jgi:VWFA-related protein
MDASGRFLFPGGREAWGKPSETDDEILLRRAPLEALAAVAQMERRRGASVGRPAAELLAQHFAEWRNLFGYFESLPALEERAFRALEDFAARAARVPAPQRNVLLGEWHSLVQLIVLGSRAGSLSAGQAEQAFRQACSALRPPNPSASALAAVRALAGGAAGLDEALAGRLLRLNGARNEAFEELKRLQNVPRLAALEPEPDAAATLNALSGAVYAAMLEPGSLLVAEDRQLLRKHRFVTGDGPAALFPESSLWVSNADSGSRFEGGFASFEEAAQPLRRRTVGTRHPDAGPPGAAQPPASAPLQQAPGETGTAPAGGGLVFKARGRVVEVYATVTDNRGRYVDNLDAGQFTVLEEGEARPVFAFEGYMAGVSVALVFDTTGSMQATLPRLKSAALQLLDDLRPVDSVAVYAFNDTVTAVLPFTEDKEAAKRAILKLHAGGSTALYEALVSVNRDLALRPGKKVIVVFTDGADNASMLPQNLAIASARERGIPIHTIAQGAALLHPELVAGLDHISRSTGGTSFLARSLNDISEVFEKISQDLLHGYLVAFQPSPGESGAWRKIEIVLTGSKGLQVRAREGYSVE